MLSKKDIEIIRNIIREEFKAALVRTVTIERGPDKQGDPEKVVKEEQWNVLDFMAAYMPKIEGALRGVQADVDRAKTQIHHMTGIMLGQEEALTTLGQAARMAIDNQNKKAIDESHS